ncbi:MAG: histidinol-phosphate transaminase [Deltaproteobacteria bacterium]|jgi:histidinol-phosphate aminotransferase|nr:histidinol-phosphate transaminase [Deltaproteobacteria bacterium]
MFPRDMIPNYINELDPYAPGRQIEDVAAELGLTRIIKLASNESCLGPSPRVLEALVKALPGVHRYGDASSARLKKAIAEKLDLPAECLVCANGSSEFILVLAHALLRPGLSAVMSKPSFSLYHQNAKASGAEAREVALKDYAHDLPELLNAVDGSTRLVFLDNPVNPTGAWLDGDEIESFLDALPGDCLLLLDEAYVEFARAPRPDYRKILSTGRTVILRTFSKLYGLAGLRAGYALMDPVLAEAVNKARQPFNINLLAQVGAMAALEDDIHVEETKRLTWKGLDFLAAELPKRGLSCHPSQANFLMADTGRIKAEDVARSLLREGVIVRTLGAYGLDFQLRITVGLEEENLALLEAVEKAKAAGS